MPLLAAATHCSQRLVFLYLCLSGPFREAAIMARITALPEGLSDRNAIEDRGEFPRLHGEDRVFGGDLDRGHAQCRAKARCLSGEMILSSAQRMYDRGMLGISVAGQGWEIAPMPCLRWVVLRKAK